MKGHTYHHGDLRRALVEVGIAALEEGDGSDPSLRDLARRIGVTPAAAYRHFGSKEALLEAIAGEGFRHLAERFEACRLDSPSERLLALGRAYVAFARERPALFRLMFGRVATPGPDAAGAVAQVAYGFLVASVADLSRRPADDPTVGVTAVRLWSIVHGFATLLLNGRLRSQDADRLLDGVLQPVVQMIAAEARASS